MIVIVIMIIIVIRLAEAVGLAVLCRLGAPEGTGYVPPVHEQTGPHYYNQYHYDCYDYCHYCYY